MNFLIYSTLAHLFLSSHSLSLLPYHFPIPPPKTLEPLLQLLALSKTHTPKLSHPPPVLSFILTPLRHSPHLTPLNLLSSSTRYPPLLTFTLHFLNLFLMSLRSLTLSLDSPDSSQPNLANLIRLCQSHTPHLSTFPVSNSTLPKSNDYQF